MSKTLLPKNYAWIKKNFSSLVKQYGGQYIVVAGGEVFVGRKPQILEKEAKKKYPKEVPIGTPIPKPEDFSCAL